MVYPNWPPYYRARYGAFEGFPSVCFILSWQRENWYARLTRSIFLVERYISEAKYTPFMESVSEWKLLFIQVRHLEPVS